MKDVDEDIPNISGDRYSDTLTGFAKTDRILESELHTLDCYGEYQLESPLNSFSDEKLNNHLYVIDNQHKCNRQETVHFMCKWLRFFVQQYKTRVLEKVQPYLE